MYDITVRAPVISKSLSIASYELTIFIKIVLLQLFLSRSSLLHIAFADDDTHWSFQIN